MNKNKAEQSEIFNKIISKCQTDDSFRQDLLDNPNAVLKEAGIEIPEGITFKALENTDKLKHIVLPQKNDELSDDDLDSIAGGSITLNSDAAMWC